ncbi:MAG: ATP-binding protein [Nannocystaceae bacterium]
MVEVLASPDKAREVGTEAASLRAEVVRLRAELGAVRREQVRAREALSAVSDLCAVIGAGGEVVSINAAGLQMLGYAADDALRLGIGDLLAAEDARRIQGEIAPNLTTPGGIWRGELRLRRRDGAFLPTQQELRSILHPSGQRELVVIARHLTADRRAAGEQARLLARLRSLTAVLENTSDFVAMADTEGRILYVNPAGMALVGRAGGDPLSLRVADLQAPRDYERLITEIFPFVREHGSWLGELFLWHADGSEIPVSQVITVVRSELGEVVGYATISRDITELKRSEHERQRAIEAAESANRAKSVFLANMSHELRTPLNAILGFAQILVRSKGLSAEQREHLEVIGRSGEHLLSLINDVLEMSKIEAGRLTLNERVFEIRRLLDDLEDMLRLRVDERGLQMEIVVDPAVPEQLVADPAKLRQVLLNLLSNAIKFTDQGGVILRAQMVDDGRPRPGDEARLRVVVEDSGRGVAPEELARLFRPFEQTRSGRLSQEGTGLGLTISQHFVRMMGGEITVESAPDRGSRFAFDISVGVPAEVRASASFDPQRRVVSLAPGEPARRVLIVEDRWQNRELLRGLLEPIGFQIREAVHGEEAVAIAAEWRPHLIWMDIRMPVMDGHEATRRIKALPGGQEVVVIAISANVFEDDRTRMLAAGCAGFICKPFREREIFEAMAEHLGCAYLYDQPAVEPPAPKVDLAGPLRSASPEWREALQEAALAADAGRLAALIGEVRGRSPALADGLAALVRDYEYDAILGLLAGAP